MTTGGGGEADDWDVVLDDNFVKAGRTEESAEERARRAARITHDHSRQAAWRAAGGEAPSPPRTPGHSRRRWRRTGMLWLFLAAVGVAGAVAWGATAPAPVRPEATDSIETIPAETARPEPEERERAKPLGTPPPAPKGSGGYRFIRTHDDGSGRPVAFDPCREVHYVVRTGNAPAGGARLLREGLAELARATGLVLVDDGTTTEAPSDDRPNRDPARYGDRWSPVLIVWSDEDESPDLAGYITGVAGPVGTREVQRGTERFVSGQVLLDSRDFRDILDRPGGRTIARGIVLHELGHLVGLNHVADRRQQMFSEGTDGGEYGKGDLRGLNQLGRGPCFP